MATTPLPPDFRDLLQCLRDHGVRYLLIGGHAVIYHGYVRSTGDIDVWIGPGEDNAARAAVALREFGLDIPDVSENLFADPNTVVQFGYPPFRIGLLTGVAGLEFEECYAARVVDEIDGLEVSVISLEHLRTSKRAAGRHKDLADLENLPEAPDKETA